MWLFGGSGFGFEEDCQVVLEVDELLGGVLDLFGGDRLHDALVVVDSIELLESLLDKHLFIIDKSSEISEQNEFSFLFLLS